ncbi:hypothetical protein L9F63_016434, partial [Diploptera punctata]
YSSNMAYKYPARTLVYRSSMNYKFYIKQCFFFLISARFRTRYLKDLFLI